MSHWKVIDANALRAVSPLETFFQSHPENVGVITDFCCMECYKGASAVTLPKSLMIIGKYAARIVVLKSTSEIVALTKHGGIDRYTFIDVVQTAEFGQFCAAVELASAGYAELAAQIAEHGRVANDYLARVAAEAQGLGGAIIEVGAAWTPQLTKRLRRHEPPTTDDIDVFVRGILTLAAKFYEAYPGTTQLPPIQKLPAEFVFRFALAGYLLAVSWTADGGVQAAASTQLANDVVDMNYVAHASYFDGIVSGDRRVQDVYDRHRWYLSNVFNADWPDSAANDMRAGLTSAH